MKECLYCKKEFEPKKPKQLFCSDKHRTYFHREKKKAENQFKKVEAALKDVGIIESGKKVAENWDEFMGKLNEIKVKSVKIYDSEKISKSFDDEYTIPRPLKISEPRPERMEGESGIDYQLRLAEWKDKRK